MSQKSFKFLIRVAWVDTDAVGVVHFSNFFRFFERAEEEFYRFLGFGFGDFGVKGLWFPRVEAFCQYKRPARFDDLLEVEVTVEELREKAVKLGFGVVNKGTEDFLAGGYLVVVAADRQTGKAVGIPLDVVERLRPFARQVL
jgi:YbgC/YbaW family acyl-CoA thioester hydrolase